jgi:hypothetical protein
MPETGKSTDSNGERPIALRRFEKTLHKRLKRWALDHDVSLEQTFNRAIREWLAREEGKK